MITVRQLRKLLSTLPQELPVFLSMNCEYTSHMHSVLHEDESIDYPERIVLDDMRWSGPSVVWTSGRP